jgi:CysZ protein
MNPISGLLSLLRGILLLPRKGIRLFVLIPLAINISLFSLLTWFGSDSLTEWVQGFLPEWLEWLHWLLFPLFMLVFILIGLQVFTLIGNLVASPFNNLLAEKVHLHLTGKKPVSAPSDENFIKLVFSSIAMELKKIFYILKRALPLLILFAIPVVNVAAPFVWLIFSAWMLTIEYSDYPLGNQGQEFTEQLESIQKQRLASLGFGFGSLVLTLIPFVNFIAMPASVAGATAFWVKKHV